MGSLRLIVGLILAVAISSFGVINMNPVSVAYYKGAVSLPLFYVLLAVFALGFLVAWLAGLFDRIRFRSQIGSLRREVKTLESNLEEVREKSGRLLPAGNPPAAGGAPGAPRGGASPQAGSSPREEPRAE